MLRRLLLAPLRARAIERYGRSRTVPAGEFDAIIIPGARVFDDGRPSPALIRRVELGCRLWRQDRAPLLVLSGRGRGPRPEAEAMAEIAEALGVTRESLVLETRAMSTEQNARYAAELIAARRILVATDSTHVLRCERVFGRYFEVAHAVGAPLGSRSRRRQALREALREAVVGDGL